jgi:toxin ParE1/3/4
MVIWTNPAKEDLKSIHDFIAADSRFYAEKVIENIISRTEQLIEFPLSGRVFRKFLKTVSENCLYILIV